MAARRPSSNTVVDALASKANQQPDLDIYHASQRDYARDILARPDATDADKAYAQNLLKEAGPEPAASQRPDYSKWNFQELDPHTGQPIQAPPTFAQDPGRYVLSQTVLKNIPQFQQILSAPSKAQFVAPPPVEPNLGTQDEHTFAALTANRAMEAMRTAGATPLVEDYKKIYEDSLGKSLDFQKTLQQQTIQQKQELAKQTALQVSQSALELQRTRQLAQEAQVRAEQEKRYEALGMPSPTTGQPTKPLPDAELDKAGGFINGIKMAQQLGQAHQAMLQKTWGGGLGGIGGRIPLFSSVAQASSPEAIQFNAQVDNALVPLARGVFGDTGATAGKDTIQAMMKDALPNALDSQLVAQGKIYSLTQQTLNNLKTQRDLFKGHYDTSALDSAIVDAQKTLDSTPKQFIPAQYGGSTDPNQVVQSGMSVPAQVTVNTQLNTSANQGVTVPPPGSILPPPAAGQPAPPAQPTAGPPAPPAAATQPVQPTTPPPTTTTTTTTTAPPDATQDQQKQQQWPLSNL